MAPKTDMGQMIFIAYTLVGVPLIMMFLAALGDSMAKFFRMAYGSDIYGNGGRRSIFDCVQVGDAATAALSVVHKSARRLRMLVLDIQSAT